MRIRSGHAWLARQAGPDTVRYGGNTSCVEVRAADGTLIVLDCGTGAHDLGRRSWHPRAAATRSPADQPYPLGSHPGLSVLRAAVRAGHEWTLRPRGLSRSLEATLAGQMEYAYFPITLGQMGANHRFHDIDEVRSTSAACASSPGSSTIRRSRSVCLEADGVALVYATDHEPHSRHLSSGPVHHEDQRHIDFLAGPT